MAFYFMNSIHSWTAHGQLSLLLHFYQLILADELMDCIANSLVYWIDLLLTMKGFRT